MFGHPLLKSVYSMTSYMPAVFPATPMQHLHVFSEYWHQGDDGWAGGWEVGGRRGRCVVHSFFTSLMLFLSMALLFSGKVR